MSEFILSNRVFNEHTLKTQCGLNINDLLDDRCKPPKRVDPHTPYLVNGVADRSSKHIQTLLGRPQAKKIVELSHVYGSDNVQGMSTLFGTLREGLTDDQSTATIGATTELYTKRVDRFADAVQQYQNSLLTYRAAVQSKSPDVKIANQNAVNAWAQMNNRFAAELSEIKRNAHSRGTPLTSAQRGINIARDSRSITKLNLTSALQTSQLVRFSRHANILGNGVAAIDFTNRIGNIQQSYESGGNWHREMFIESLSFGASAAVGAYAVEAGIALFLAATPAGWAMIIIGGLIIIGTATFAAIATNTALKNNGGSIYDSLMQAIAR